VISYKDINAQKLIQDESLEFLRQYYHSFPNIKWLAAPWKTKYVQGRVNQLVQASKVGFNIPKTLITTNKKKFFTFFNKCNQIVIIKSINPNSITYKDREKEYFYTEVIDEEKVRNINFSLLKNSPTLFQEFIEPKYEIRITSINGKHFAVKIVSNITDWRKQKAVVTCENYELPNEVTILVSKYLELYDLNFGCFDLIKGKDNKYYFLEVNANGQWLWLEKETDVPIGKAILNYLQK
jgi:glutathione synthase/RimK-type ligase-like ATP-grasp enzyme